MQTRTRRQASAAFKSGGSSKLGDGLQDTPRNAPLVLKGGNHAGKSSVVQVRSQSDEHRARNGPPGATDTSASPSRPREKAPASTDMQAISAKSNFITPSPDANVPGSQASVITDHDASKSVSPPEVPVPRTTQHPNGCHAAVLNTEQKPIRSTKAPLAADAHDPVPVASAAKSASRKASPAEALSMPGLKAGDRATNPLAINPLTGKLPSAMSQGAVTAKAPTAKSKPQSSKRPRKPEDDAALNPGAGAAKMAKKVARPGSIDLAVNPLQARPVQRQQNATEVLAGKLQRQLFVKDFLKGLTCSREAVNKARDECLRLAKDGHGPGLCHDIIETAKKTQAAPHKLALLYLLDAVLTSIKKGTVGHNKLVATDLQYRSLDTFVNCVCDQLKAVLAAVTVVGNSESVQKTMTVWGERRLLAADAISQALQSIQPLVAEALKQRNAHQVPGGGRIFLVPVGDQTLDLAPLLLWSQIGSFGGDNSSHLKHPDFPLSEAAIRNRVLDLKFKPQYSKANVNWDDAWNDDVLSHFSLKLDGDDTDDHRTSPDEWEVEEDDAPKPKPSTHGPRSHHSQHHASARAAPNARLPALPSGGTAMQASWAPPAHAGPVPGPFAAPTLPAAQNLPPALAPMPSLATLANNQPLPAATGAGMYAAMSVGAAAPAVGGLGAPRPLAQGALNGAGPLGGSMLDADRHGSLQHGLQMWREPEGSQPVLSLSADAQYELMGDPELRKSAAADSSYGMTQNYGPLDRQGQGQPFWLMGKQTSGPTPESQRGLDVEVEYDDQGMRIEGRASQAQPYTTAAANDYMGAASYAGPNSYHGNTSYSDNQDMGALYEVDAGFDLYRPDHHPASSPEDSANPPLPPGPPPDDDLEGPPPLPPEPEGEAPPPLPDEPPPLPSDAHDYHDSPPPPAPPPDDYLVDYSTHAMPPQPHHQPAQPTQFDMGQAHGMHGMQGQHYGGYYEAPMLAQSLPGPPLPSTPAPLPPSPFVPAMNATQPAYYAQNHLQQGHFQQGHFQQGHFQQGHLQQQHSQW